MRFSTSLIALLFILTTNAAVVDAQTLKVIARIPVGEVPWGVAVAPAPGAAPAT